MDDKKREQDEKKVFWVVDEKIVSETLNEENSLASAKNGLYHLKYACLLVPRNAGHYLKGDLSDSILEWIPNICTALGWQLEYIAVQPEYLQWIVHVQPNTSPGNLMRIMRQQTSELIFNEYPRFKQENSSGDFWAPGYLIMGGNQPHPLKLIQDYIHQTRLRLAGDASTDAPLPDVKKKKKR